ncbi:MAG TPA: BatA domain-containing protein, partial [Caulifigura sp.]|nr:BatA domain-containing protein [Caulifigura sp.]
MGFLGGWMLNPWLFAAGGLLVAAPILIHLLNRRKFRIVDWAAMDFLLEADQRNRRRVQIEEMILLALRCLAMLLAGLFVARPFLPSSITRALFQGSRTERVVLIDDSPSMEATSAGTSPFRTAKKRVTEFITALAEQGGGDSLTLCVTSRPDRPLIRDAVVDNNSALGLVGEVEELTVADLPSRLDQSLVAVRGLVQGKSERINRV